MPNIAIESSTGFSHVKPGDTTWRRDGLRDFFSTRTSASPRPRTETSLRSW